MTKKIGVGAQAELIVDAILEDLTDRRGFRQAWDEVDEEIQVEIRQDWMLLVRRIIERG